MSINTTPPELKKYPTIAAETAGNEAPTVLLSEETLAEIKARADAATPGPWEGKYGRSNHTVFGSSKIKGQKFIICDVISHEDNTDFIAFARSDIPALLAHIEALQVELTALRYLLKAVQP